MNPSQLPKFNQPPVVEVALSLMFEPLSGFRAAHFGHLWVRYPDLTITEDQPELNVPTEEPAAPAPPPPPRFELMQLPRIRAWFRTENGTQLLQIQHNRLVYNWRKGDTSEPYPSYEVVRHRFDEVVEKFKAFLKDENLGTIRPMQCEVTYVNHIVGEHGWPHSKVAEVTRLWAEPSTGGFLPPVEDVRFLARFVIPDASGGFLGRFSVDLQPAYLVSSGLQVLALTLVARGKPLSNDLPGAGRFLDIGHEWIVRGFTEITTPEMHKKWGRTL